MIKLGQLVKDQDDLNNLECLLNRGWVLDPLIKSNPVKLDSVAIYHLIHYTDDEVKEMAQIEIKGKVGEFDDVEDVQSVSPDHVKEYIEQGYTVHTIYAKNVMLVKRKEKGGE